MNEIDIILGFVRSCTRGNLGFSECSPVFIFGSIALAMAILGITLAVLIISEKRKAKSGERGLAEKRWEIVTRQYSTCIYPLNA